MTTFKVSLYDINDEVRIIEEKIKMLEVLKMDKTSYLTQAKDLEKTVKELSAIVGLIVSRNGVHAKNCCCPNKKCPDYELKR